MNGRGSLLEDRTIVRNPLTQVDACFEGAGEEESLEIWWVKNAELEEWPCSEYGTFLSGSCYVVLATTCNELGKLKWNVHYWLGKDAPLDAHFVGALKATELHRHLQNLSTQHREEQGHESDKFLAYFVHGNIHIKQGGPASILRTPKPFVHDKRLYHIKGKRFPRVRLVPLELASLNSGDAFLLDTGPVIYTWIGQSANARERALCLQLSACLRLNVKGWLGTNPLSWRRTKCEIRPLFQESPTLVSRAGNFGFMDDDEFWWEFDPQSQRHRSRKRPKIPNANQAGDDKKAEMDAVMDLYKIEDSGAEDPTIVFIDRAVNGCLAAEILQSHLVFLLDCDTELFVWMGVLSPAKARSTALQMAKDSLTQFERPMKNTPIITLYEGHESPTFMAKFDDWWRWRPGGVLPIYGPATTKHTKQSTGVYDHKQVIKSMMAYTQKTYVRPEDPIREDKPGTGSLNMYRVEMLDLVPVDANDLGVFDSGFSYICLYSYVVFGRMRHMIYFWEGAHCPAASWLTWWFDLSEDLVQGLQEDGVPPLHCRARMLEESEHFLSLFKDKQMIILNGNVLDSCAKGKNTLFQISNSFYPFAKCNDVAHPENCLVLQVPCDVSSLSSLHVYLVVCNKTQIFIWYGSYSDEVERLVAKRVCRKFRVKDVVAVEEGREPQQFWDAVASRTRSCDYYRVPKNWARTRFNVRPLVFRGARSGSSELGMEIVRDPTPQDFGPSDVLVVLIYCRVHLWMGRILNAKTQRMARSLVQELRRRDSNITGLVDEQDGNESPFLRSVLPQLEHKQPISDPYQHKEQRLIEMGVQGRALAEGEYQVSSKDNLFWLRD